LNLFSGRSHSAVCMYGTLAILCAGRAAAQQPYAASQQNAVSQQLAPQASSLPDDPSVTLAARNTASSFPFLSSTDEASASSSTRPPEFDQQAGPEQEAPRDSSGKPIRAQQKRVFGLMANYTSVTGGTTPPPPGWKTNAHLAFKQSTDYSAFVFSLLTSTIAYAQDSHPSLDTWNGGNAPYWAYTWRGLVDKTDGVAQGTFLFPSLLHEDVRYYAMGRGPIWKRTLHAAESVVVARTYSGRSIPNVAGIMGQIGTQAASTTYYPPGSEDFGVLATKFTYACLRQAGLTVMREFSPDVAAHLHFHKKRQQP
jgi:hypothetical protein